MRISALAGAFVALLFSVSALAAGPKDAKLWSSGAGNTAASSAKAAASKLKRLLVKWKRGALDPAETILNKARSSAKNIKPARVLRDLKRLPELQAVSNVLAGLQHLTVVDLDILEARDDASYAALLKSLLPGGQLSSKVEWVSEDKVLSVVGGPTDLAASLKKVLPATPSVPTGTLPSIGGLGKASKRAPGSVNDAFFWNQWGLNATQRFFEEYGIENTGDFDVNAPEAWALMERQCLLPVDGLPAKRPEVVVAVIDTGVYGEHPDLKGNMWRNFGEIPNNGIDDDGNGYVDDVFGWDFYNDNNNPTDDTGHGTHCAGILAARTNNKNDVAGAAGPYNPVKIMPLKFISKFDFGFMSDALLAMNYVAWFKANKRANIVATSNSYGCNNCPPDDPQNGGAFPAIRQAIETHASLDIMFVAAAGNENINNDDKSNDVFPAQNNGPLSITVGSSDWDGARSWFSNYGTSTVQIAAPGVAYSTYCDGVTDTTRCTNPRLVWAAGTSMATPLVAGIAAAIKYTVPLASMGEIRQAIFDTAKSSGLLLDEFFAYGLVDFHAALQRVIELKSITNLVKKAAGRNLLQQ